MKSQQKQSLVGNTQNLQPKDQQQIGLSNSSHPFACIFTCAFKLAAFLVYILIRYRYFLFGNFFSDVNTFIIVVLLSALDFWTVKNVTGRLLVGLRWWNDFDQNGKQIWKYQSADVNFKPNAFDSSIFWTSQLAITGTWAFFLVMKVLTFSIFWSLLVLINLSLSGINLYQYYNCRGKHKQKAQKLASSFLGKGLKLFMGSK